MRRFAVVALLALLPAPAAAAEPASRATASLVLSDRTLLALGDDARAESLVERRGGELVSRSLRVWRLPTTAAVRTIPELERLGGLRYAEPDLPVRAASHLPGDPLGTPDIGWHLYRIGADRAEPPAPGFPITVVDTGLDLANPEFSMRPNTIALNPQVASDPANGQDYHGTIVTSTAAAPLDGRGAVGVYPQAALRVYDVGTLTTAEIIAGLDAARAAGPSVINLSLGTSQRLRVVEEATLAVFATGSLVVAASGNDFDRGNPVSFPASFPHVLTVGATNRSDQPSSFSSSNLALDIAAPGEDIPSQDPRDPNAYFTDSGTSFSAPMVAAAAAWVKTVRPSLDITQLFELMRRSARDVGQPGYDERTGFGLLDIPAALAEPAPRRDPQEPNDEIDQVVAGQLFDRGKPPVRGRFTARLDVTEDPNDVYRLVVPARRTTVINVTADDDVVVTLLSGRIGSIAEGIGRNRLAVSSRPGRQPERITYANRTGRSLSTFLHVRPARNAASGNPDYAVSITARANARR